MAGPRPGATPFQVILLLSIPFTGLLSNAVLVPVLPKIAETLKLPFGHVTWLVVLPSIVAGVFIPVAGYLSDRWTRTIVLAPSLALYGLGGLLAGISPYLTHTPFTILLVARFLQGIGYAGTIALVIALAGDLLEPSERPQVLGSIELSNALGKASGPVIGGALATAAWNAPFFVFPVLALPLSFLLWTFLGRRPSRTADPPGLMDVVHQLRTAVQPKFASLSSIFLTAFWGVNVILLLLALTSRELAGAGVQGMARGTLITIPEIAVGLSAWGAGRLLKDQLSTRSRPLTLGGLLVLGAGVGAAALFRSPWGFLGAATFAGFGGGTALAASNALVANAVSDGERGVLASVYGAFRALGVAVIPLFFALSSHIHNEPVALGIIAGFITVTCMLVLRLLKPEKILARASPPGKAGEE